MKQNKKKYSMITLVSASVLISLAASSAIFNKNVKADTINTEVTTSDKSTDQNNDNDQLNSDQTTNDQLDQDNNSNAEDDLSTTDTEYSVTSDDNQLPKRTLTALKDANIDLNSLSSDQIAELQKINYQKNDEGTGTGTLFTYHQYRNVAKKMINLDSTTRIPFFNAKKIKNMRATRTRDAQTGKVANLEIWDSWVVQDEETGQTANYKGYQLAIAMMGIPKKKDAHIYLLYNKYGDNKLSHWKTAGPIFGYHANNDHQEWSGSATLNKDGSVQLFYTDVDHTQGDNNQKIATVNLKLKVDRKGKLKIIRKRHRHILFEGDGYHYQNYDQWKETNQGADNIALRDAHVIKVNGKRYLVFEASTGYENYQDADQVYNWQNYGGSDAEAIQEFLGIISDSDMTSRASWANAAIGLLRLDDNENNPSVEKVYSPLISSPMVSDEIERPDLLFLNGKYYLFAITRLNRGTGDDLWMEANKEVGDNVAMLGWVSDHLTHGYQPLNGDSAVLTASVPFNWRTSTYSYYAMPVKGHDDQVLITSYMTNRGYAAGAGKRSTWGPSFLVQLNPDGTTQVLDKATQQGDWIYDEDSVDPNMIVDDIEKARLKGEPDPDDSGKLKKIPLRKHKSKHKKHKTSRKHARKTTRKKHRRVTHRVRRQKHRRR